ncbi:MAG: DUF262 domain-containing protein [Gammaproteobacteria bacterium]|nr:DUF262 domain-containing protein [Gammaproteobacteria bacterium]
MEAQQSYTPVDEQDVEGLDTQGGSWGDYPIDALLIRHETRTVFDVIRRTDKGTYVMDPEFQRDFIWPEDKQSKLIESVLMRIPLPVFYLAEDRKGRMIVVDGLQRLATFRNFISDGLRLRLPDRADLNGKRFTDLEPKFQNRIEDCNLIFYIIDFKAPDRARLDIFDRVNSGVPLKPQQMRNSLFMGPATRFLKDEAKSDIFLKATGWSLNTKIMRDREFVNRFCAFQLLGLDKYRGDMDVFLAECLRHMNRMEVTGLARLSEELRRSLANNYLLCKFRGQSKNFARNFTLTPPIRTELHIVGARRPLLMKVCYSGDRLSGSIRRKGSGEALSMHRFGTLCPRACPVTLKQE